MGQEKVQIICNEAPKPAGPYSQAIAAGPYLFVAGQRGVDPATGQMGADIEEQTRLCLENVRRILEAAGSSLADAVRCTVYLTDLNDFQRMNQVYQEIMPAPCPARTTVGAVLRNMLVEIEVMALRREI
ncbi:RidA family protein [Hominifimenecus sp. rT4P-3]|uniref:RidA family protein n=1 Tax=Hominifimenecus sp. rT4P-3 TaxID=3242979 RepID=UPI003DA3DA20